MLVPWGCGSPVKILLAGERRCRLENLHDNEECIVLAVGGLAHKIGG